METNFAALNAEINSTFRRIAGDRDGISGPEWVEFDSIRDELLAFHSVTRSEYEDWCEAQELLESV